MALSIRPRKPLDSLTAGKRPPGGRLGRGNTEKKSSSTVPITPHTTSTRSNSSGACCSKSCRKKSSIRLSSTLLARSFTFIGRVRGKPSRAVNKITWGLGVNSFQCRSLAILRSDSSSLSLGTRIKTDSFFSSLPKSTSASSSNFDCRTTAATANLRISLSPPRIRQTQYTRTNVVQAAKAISFRFCRSPPCKSSPAYTVDSFSKSVHSPGANINLLPEGANFFTARAYGKLQDWTLLKRVRKVELLLSGSKERVVSWSALEVDRKGHEEFDTKGFFNLALTLLNILGLLKLLRLALMLLALVFTLISSISLE